MEDEVVDPTERLQAEYERQVAELRAAYDKATTRRERRRLRRRYRRLRQRTFGGQVTEW